MSCPGCGTQVPDDARFCPGCGTVQPEQTEAAVREYGELLRQLHGRAEAWAEAELAALRRELHIRTSTHDRLVAELGHRAGPEGAVLRVWVDAHPIAGFRAGEQCVLRARIRNEAPRPLASVGLEVDTSAAPGPHRAGSERPVGPGEDVVLAVWFRPPVAGQHRAELAVALTPLRGEPSAWVAEVPFAIGAPAALQQQIHIDASAQKVGIFENIGAASKGGLLDPDQADWRELEVRPRTGAAPAEVAPAVRLAVGTVGTGAIVAIGDVVAVVVDVHRGKLVAGLTPELARVLRPGDKLEVHVLGHDGAGVPLFGVGRGTGRVERAPVADGPVEVGPGDDLAAVLAKVPAGAKVVVRGDHVGPIVLDRPIELSGKGGATVRSAVGPAVRVAADVVVRELVVRGAAPPGHYAVDAVEVRTGRVVLDGCIVSSDAPENLVPGRAIAVTGPATLEVRGCRIEGSGVGVAVDVSWSGFATESARGARVRVVGCELVGVGTGVAVAGADRELTVVRTRFSAVAEAAVRVLRGARCALEETAVPKRMIVADPGAEPTVK